MINKIQFQKGLSLEEFIKNFRNEKQCAEYLEKLRWGRGFLCSKCGGEHYIRHWKDKRLFYRCKSCRHRNTLISGTMFENTKLPLTKWFLAIYLLTQTKKGASGVDLRRKLGVNKDTAWGMRQKILAVMKSREDEQMLDNQVQIDDVYYGGKLEGKSGRGSENKQAFLAAVSTDGFGNPLKVKFHTVNSFSKAEVSCFAKKYIKEGAIIHSDALAAFNALNENYEHSKTVMNNENKEVQKKNFKKFNAINTLISNLKNFLRGTHHDVSDKYLNKYFAEFQYRFNRRFDLRAILDRFLYVSVNYFKPLTLNRIKLGAA